MSTDLMGLGDGLDEIREAEDEWAATLPAGASIGSCIRTCYLDSKGHEQHAVIYSTADPQEMIHNGNGAKLAMTTYYQMLGCELMSAVVDVCSAEQVGETQVQRRRERPRVQLELVQGGGAVVVAAPVVEKPRWLRLVERVAGLG